MLDLLLDTCTRLFADAPDQALHDRIEAGEWPQRLWADIEDNGLPLLLVPDELGGIGAGYVEAVAVLRLAGAFALPLPLADTMVAQHLLALAGERPLGGPLVLAPNTYRERLVIDAESRTVSGHVRRIPWLSIERKLVVVGEAPDRSTLLAVVTPEHIVDHPLPPSGEPLASATLAGTAADIIAPLPQGWTLQRARALGALGRAAQTAGALERILDLVIEHAQGREQFGRPIGRFQAVQQNVAVLAGEVAAVRVAVELAAANFERDANLVGAAAAKARASEASGKAAAIAHQVHAAIGFTREHDLQLFTRRLWTWRDEFGNEEEWHEHLGGVALRAGADGLWAAVIGR
jgi:alkylation response protein AidB-like acyl-CoA dehydrogenase